MTDEDEQIEMFYKVRLDYTTILNTMIDSGEMSKLGTDAVCILLVMRRFTQVYDRNDPFCKISKEKIGEFTGLSESTVNRKIKILVENGYVEIINRGHKKRNAYRITEKLLAVSQSGDQNDDKVLTHTFIPYLREQRIRELKYFEKHGDLPRNSPIQIRPINIEFNNNINITIAQNNHQYNAPTVVIDRSASDDVDISKLPKWIQDKVLPRINQETEKQTEELKENLKLLMDTIHEEES